MGKLLVLGSGKGAALRGRKIFAFALFFFHGLWMALIREMGRSAAGIFALLFIAPQIWPALAAPPDALEEYVRKPDPTYRWEEVDQKRTDGFMIHRISLTSQTWRENLWKHDLVVVRPEKVRNTGSAFLFITGDGDGRKQVDLLKAVAERSGAVCAVITRIPNQPLYEGRKEDALIAYTFDQYLRTGDRTWPVLFPMVKSAVRAMDAVQALAQTNWQQKIETFAVSGASKRGWTTWLTAAMDRRVNAIAPMVIDMLNMKVQAQWAEKVYGKQSEQIKDYTDANLIGKMDDPRMVELRQWVDPYSYRQRYTMPKLLLLGSNDPYWTVDSLRHYWGDLPEPKLVYQTPNAGHDLGGGKDATQTLAAWFQSIADHQPLPHLDWTFKYETEEAILTIQCDRPMQKLTLWTASSEDRDFRNEKWEAKTIPLAKPGKKGEARIHKNEMGYQAFLLEGELESSTGHAFKLSTEARVIPDEVK